MQVVINIQNSFKNYILQNSYVNKELNVRF